MAIEQDPANLEEVNSREAAPRHHWFQILTAVLYVFFCFEIGVILLIFPWLDLWQRSFFSGLGGASLGDLWNSPYLRGAVSGFGLLDIGISLVELFRLRRFARA